MGLFVQAETKGGAYINFASYIDDLVMGLDDVLYDSKPEAGTADLAAPAFICPVKALKDPVQVLLFDAGTVIRDFNISFVGIQVPEAGGYVAAIIAIFNGVFYYIDNGLSYLVPVCMYHYCLFVVIFELHAYLLIPGFQH